MTDLGPPANDQQRPLAKMRNPEKCCATCDNYQPPIALDGTVDPNINGECHEGSPDVLLVPQQGAPTVDPRTGEITRRVGVGVQATFAPVLPTSWCGKWKPITEDWHDPPPPIGVPAKVN